MIVASDSVLFSGCEDRGAERCGALVAIRRRLVERALDDLVVLRPTPKRIDRRRRHRVVIADVVHHRFGPAAKRRLAGEQVVEQHAGREDVDAVVDLPAQVHLRRDVAGCAHDHVGFRAVGRADARNAEIGELDAAIAHHEDVGRLDVAVPHRVLVRELQRIEQLRHHADRVVLVEMRLARHVLAQTVAFDVFHRDVGMVGVFAVLVDRDDARVAQRAGRLRLAAESAGQRLGFLLVVDQFLADGLDRDRSLDDGVVAAIDDAHRPFAEDLGDRIFAESLRDDHGSRLRSRSLSSPASSSPAPCSFACVRSTAPACRSRRASFA